MEEKIMDKKAKKILAIQLLADAMEMNIIELEGMLIAGDEWFGDLKNKVKILKNNATNLRKSGNKFFISEEEQLSFGEIADEVIKFFDDLLDIEENC